MHCIHRLNPLPHPCSHHLALQQVLAMLPAIVLGIDMIMLLACIAFKWCILGRQRPGTYPLWGWQYIRWWTVRAISGQVRASLGLQQSRAAREARSKLGPSASGVARRPVRLPPSAPALSRRACHSPTHPPTRPTPARGPPHLTKRLPPVCCLR